VKFEINPKELLALHDVLDAIVANTAGLNDDENHLSRVYGRIRSRIISSLFTNSNDNNNNVAFETAMSREQEKIDKLKVDLENVKKEQDKLPTVAKFEFLHDDDDPNFIYPRKGGAMNHHQQSRKKK